MQYGNWQFFQSARDGSVVQIEIQLQDIHARFAKQTKLPSFHVILDQRPDALLTHVSRLGNARNLIPRRIGRNVGIEPGPRCGHQVDWNGLAGIFGAELVDVALNALYKLRI